jgi:hypothetical protein
VRLPVDQLIEEIEAMLRAPRIGETFYTEGIDDVRECGNCGENLAWGDVAYLIQKGSMYELIDDKLGFQPTDSPWGAKELVLCPNCYDNNWVIGEPDDV